MTIIYGIHNCDTVKKAQKWLTANHIQFQFHDLRKDGLNRNLLTQLSEKSSWDLLINKRSTTFRNLDDSIKQNLTGDTAIETVLEQPTLLKRPLLIEGEELHLGFKPAQYEQIFTHE